MFLAWAYFTGQLGGYGQGVPAVEKPDVNVHGAADAAGQAGQHGLDWFLATAWAPAALIAVVVASVAVKFWQKIGSFGRGTLLVVGAIAVTIFVLGIKH